MIHDFFLWRASWMKLSDGQVSQMTSKEFDKYEGAISEFMRHGTFSYDLFSADR